MADDRVVGEWLRAAVAAAPKSGASVRLLTSSGALWAGAASAGRGASVTVAPADSGLPWTVAIDSGDTSGLESALSGRRRLFVRADEPSLSTALLSLLDNAVKYSDGHASIDVAVAARPDGQIALSVADKGLGIPAQEREAVFGKIVRGADAERLGLKGTGLGLALVSHIVAAHDGRVELESTVGAGSTFTIVLPVDRTS